MTLQRTFRALQHRHAFGARRLFARIGFSGNPASVEVLFNVSVGADDMMVWSEVRFAVSPGNAARHPELGIKMLKFVRVWGTGCRGIIRNTKC